MWRVVAVSLAATVMYMVAAGPALAATRPWTGSIRVDSALVYDAPGGSPIGTLARDTPVTVASWAHGPALTTDNFTWASIDDPPMSPIPFAMPVVSGGATSQRFVHSSVLRHSSLADPPPA